jgi:hypothetical protein
MQAAMGMVNQDMGAWKANIDKIAGSTGMSNSPVTELVKQNQAQQQYLANAMMPWMMAAQNMVPYTNLVNQTVSEQATQGVRQQALGSQIGNILSYGLIDPTVAQALNQSITNAGITNAAALGGLGQAGVQSLLATQPGLANLPGVTTAIPGQSG